MNTVTIAREQYDHLREAAEMLDDIAAYDRAKSKAEEGIPQEHVLRILNGDHPIAVFRDWRGLSQSALSRKSGVNRVQINDIERGRKNGSVETLKKIADALDVLVDDLID